MEIGRMGRNALSIAVSLALVGSANAATITVGTPGSCNLNAAISSANSDSSIGGCIAGNGADLILLPSGDHYPSIPTPAITSDVEVRGLGIGTSVAYCEGGGRLFFIGGEEPAGFSAPTVTLTRFTINNCSFTGGSGNTGGGGAAGMGGAVFVYDGIVSLQRMAFIGNSVGGGAGSTTPYQLIGGGGGGGLRGAGAVAGAAAPTAAGIGSGGGGGGGPANAASPIAGGAAGAPNGGNGGSGMGFNPLPQAGGFGGGGGGGAGLVGDNGGQTGATGGFGGGGGGGGTRSTTATTAFAGNGGAGGFGGGGGGGGSTNNINAGNGGAGGFGGGGGGHGAYEGGNIPASGPSGFGAQPSANMQGGGGAAFGGAMFVRAGVINISNTTFTNSTSFGALGQRLGGALFVIDEAADDAHRATGANGDGMPADLAAVSGCSVSFSNSTATSNAGTDTNNADVYGTSRSTLQEGCKEIFVDGFE